jgi:hypothetical protein
MIVSAIIFAFLLGAFIFSILPSAGPARRVLSVSLFVALIAIVYGGGLELLGRPKPLRLEWRDAAAAKVLSAVPVEGKAIYVWLSLPDSPEPRAYTLRWSVDMAQQLQTAMSDAEANGTAVQMTMPFDGGLDDREPKFYAMPQPALPAKDYQGSTTFYQQPDKSS